MRHFFKNTTIATRLLISSLIFTLPIALLLYFTVIGINENMRFSELEAMGNRYQRPLETLLNLLPQRGALALRYAGGDKAARSAIDALDSGIDNAFSGVLSVQKIIGGDLQTDQNGLAKRNRSSLYPQNVQERWQALKVALSNQKPEETRKGHDALVDDIRALISHVGDTSNLILDPDLDSYYLMDMTLLTLPQTQQRLSDIMAFGASVLTNGKITQEDRVTFAVMKAILGKEVEQIKGDVDTSLKEDANFYGISKTLQDSLPVSLKDYAASNQAFVDILDDLSRVGKDVITLDKFFVAGEKARADSFNLWNVAVREMDVLIEKRLADYSNRKILYLISTAVALLIAGFTVLIIGKSITRPLSNVGGYAERVAQGNFNAVIEGTYGGELRKLASDIEFMVGQLKTKLSFAEGILGGLTLPCVVADPQGKISYVNKYILQMLGKGGIDTDYIGKGLDEFFTKETELSALLNETLRESKILVGKDYEGTSSAGEKYYVKADIAPIFDMDKKTLGAIAVFSILTQLKRQEAQLEKHNKKMAAVASEAEIIAVRVSEAVSELSSQIDQVSKGASIQQERATSTATAMEEMNSTVLEVAKTCLNAASHSDKTKVKAQEGSEVVGQAVKAIGHVSDVSALLKEKMATLGEQAKAIDRIMNVISDIADQTNLLALNAAIEAARAGEAGRGFAVVADEVRKLAEKTMSATHEVEESIKGIQDGTASNLSSVAEAVTAVDTATALAEKSGAALKEIVVQIDVESDMVRSIAAASEEQSATSNEINHAVEDVARISGETSKGMENAAKAVAGLAEQAKKLADLISTMQS